MTPLGDQAEAHCPARKNLRNKAQKNSEKELVKISGQCSA
jgi:hypothetical protein